MNRNASIRMALAFLLSTALACALPARRSVPLVTVTFEGHRYVARVDVDGVTGVPLMVHGNSTMYLSLTHRVADRLNGRPVAKVGDYGYSSRGKSSIVIRSIRVGGESFAGKRDVSVFDFTETGDSPFQGMIGVPFLFAARAAVDFTTDHLLLGVTRQPDPDGKLLARGYRWAPLSKVAGGRTAVSVFFPAIGRTLPITPSTVANALTLHAPLFLGKVPMARTSSDRSPNGTTPEQFRSGRIAIRIADVAMSDSASLENIAEYGKISQRELSTFGYLGYDWMKRHRAVLDYANLRLYFKP